MLLIRLLFRNSGLRLVVGIVAGLIGGFASAVSLSLIQPALEQAGTSHQALLLFSVICAISVALTTLSEYLASIQSQDVLMELRLRLAHQILATPVARLEEIGVPRLLAALTEDASSVASALPGLAQLCPQVAIALGCFAYMLWLSRLGFLVIVGLTVVSLFVCIVPRRIAVRATEAGRLESDALMLHFRALAEGVKQLQIHRPKADHFLERRLAPAARSSRRHAIRAFSMFLVASNFARACFLVAILVVLLLGPPLDLPRSTMLGFTLAVLYLNRPMEVVVSWLPAIDRAQVGVSNIQGIGIALDEPARSPARREPTGSRHIELSGLTYTRPSQSGDSFTVGPVNLALSPGEVVFLVGGNGSGKTTFAKLLAGLYVADGGQIRVDGQVPRDLEEYRSNFSVIFSDSYPFDDLDRTTDAGEIARLAGDLGLGPLLADNRRPEPSLLSHGQRKRLLLLAALIEDRPAYVFDEWAAEQDPVFRRVFYLEILPALRARGKTVLAITHDEQYFDTADRVLRIEYGKIVSARARRSAPELAEASSNSA